MSTSSSNGKVGDEITSLVGAAAGASDAAASGAGAGGAAAGGTGASAGRELTGGFM
jgi:hypothetical protein